jgi:hypothetical protein
MSPAETLIEVIGVVSQSTVLASTVEQPVPGVTVAPVSLILWEKVGKLGDGVMLTTLDSPGSAVYVSSPPRLTEAVDPSAAGAAHAKPSSMAKEKASDSDMLFLVLFIEIVPQFERNAPTRLPRTAKRRGPGKDASMEWAGAILLAAIRTQADPRSGLVPMPFVASTSSPCSQTFPIQEERVNRPIR